MGQQGAPGVLLKLTKEYVDHSAYLLVYSEKYPVLRHQHSFFPLIKTMVGKMPSIKEGRKIPSNESSKSDMVLPLRKYKALFKEI